MSFLATVQANGSNALPALLPYLFTCIYSLFFSLLSQSKDDQIQVIGNLKNISMASSKLLLAAKSLSVDPGAANAKNLLAVAARCEEFPLHFVLLWCKQFPLCYIVWL